MSDIKNEEGFPSVVPVTITQKSDDVPAEKGHYGSEDVGAAMLEETGESFEYTEEEARAVLWKIDLHLLPTVTAINSPIFEATSLTNP